MHNTAPPATPDERIDAIEELLFRLIETLEMLEPNEPFTAATLTNWIATCRQAERRHQIADARAQVVFAQLCERLQLVESSTPPPEADPAAQQAAAAAISKAHRRQKD